MGACSTPLVDVEMLRLKKFLVISLWVGVSEYVYGDVYVCVWA